FFFQAEDGIRDFHVTGVQTCALPISLPVADRAPGARSGSVASACGTLAGLPTWAKFRGLDLGLVVASVARGAQPAGRLELPLGRSEERRVGKECRSRGWR